MALLNDAVVPLAASTDRIVRQKASQVKDILTSGEVNPTVGGWAAAS
jgi:hypothetical protein